VVAAPSGGTDRAVPPNRRTPQITAMETERTQLRQQVRAMEERLSRLDPQRDSVEIARIKQERSTAENKANFLTFSINTELDKPEPAPGAAARP
jgi:hypothetical protein